MNISAISNFRAIGFTGTEKFVTPKESYESREQGKPNKPTMKSDPSSVIRYFQQNPDLTEIFGEKTRHFTKTQNPKTGQPVYLDIIEENGKVVSRQSYDYTGKKI